MDTNESVSGLGEALAPYQPSSMPAATWARFGVDAVDLVTRLPLRDERHGRQCLSRLAVFLADVADTRPEASLKDLLSRDQVEGHLKRALDDSATKPGTVQNRQGTLNALLELLEGHRPRTRREAEPHLMPYAVDVLRTVTRTAHADGSRGAQDLARAIVAGLTCDRLPSRRRPDAIEVTIEERSVRVGDRTRDFPDGWDLPASGVVDYASMERARAWSNSHLEFSLDGRRLELTVLVEAVRSRPALDVLQLEGLGRDRLTAAVAAVDTVPADELRRLRNPLEHW